MSDDDPPDWRAWVAVALLSLTTILTAWSAFQASKWGGLMSIRFSEASAARLLASRYDGDANRVITVQVGLFTQWLQASSGGDSRQAEFLADAFPEPLASAFDAWQAQPDTSKTPFGMPEFRIPADAEAQAADARANDLFDEALDNNQRSDDYTLLTVLFASVLFFGSMASRARRGRVQGAFLAMAAVLLVGAGGLLIVFPKVV